jgi:hypothetical protein
MSLGIFKKAFSTVQIDNLKSYFSSIFAPLPNYKVYSVLATQSGTSVPTMTVLNNTIGNIVWTYSSVGVYYGTLANTFLASKLFLPIPVRGFDVINTSGTELGYYTLYRVSNSQIVLQSRNNSDVSSNGILSNAPIEIIVYN